MKIGITRLLQILSFSSRFRIFFKLNHLSNCIRRPTVVAENISQLVAPPDFFSFLRACLKIIFFQKLFAQLSKFVFYVDCWILLITYNHFRDVLEISEIPKILRPKSFSNL